MSPNGVGKLQIVETNMNRFVYFRILNTSGTKLGLSYNDSDHMRSVHAKSDLSTLCSFDKNELLCLWKNVPPLMKK